MRIFPRLLAILVVLAIAPVTIVTIIDLRALRAFGEEAAARARRVVVDNRLDELQTVLLADADTLARRREALEQVAWSQAHEVEDRLVHPPPTSHPVRWPEDFDAGGVSGLRHPGSQDGATVPPGALAMAVARGVSRNEVASQVASLGDMGDVFRLLKGRGAIHSQYVALESGLRAVYPGHRSVGTDDARQLDWYRAVRTSADLAWRHSGAESGDRVVATICVPVMNPDGTFAGVTGLDAPLDTIVDAMAVRRWWPNGASVFVVASSGQEGRIEVVAKLEAAEGEELRVVPWHGADPEELEWLTRDLASRGSGWKAISWHGEEFYRIQVSAGPDDLSLVGVFPGDAAASNVHGVDEHTLERMRAVLLRNGLVAAAVLLLALLASVLGARSVTRPLRSLGKMAGWLANGRFDEQVGSLRPPEMRVLGEHFNEMGPKLRELARMGDSLRIAKLVQKTLLPHHSPRLAGFDIAGRSVYCHETGGDYFDFLDLAPLGPHRLGIVVGDVAGHGVAAALLMATARGILRSLATTDLTPAEVITRLNRVFSARDLGDGRFMTLLYMILDCRDGSVRSVGAGHEPAVVYDPEGDRFTEVSGCADIALGIRPDWNYREAERVTLVSGQILVVGTDGIWESRNPAGEQFGQERFLDVIRSHASRSAADIAGAILESVDIHRGARARDDDVTLVVVKSLGGCAQGAYAS